MDFKKHALLNIKKCIRIDMMQLSVRRPIRIFKTFYKEDFSDRALY